MRTFRKVALQLVTSVFAIVVATDLAWAQRLVFQGPETRMEEWRYGLLSFIEKHPDLASDQVLALQNLAGIDDTATFATTLNAKKRDYLADRLQELGRVLPYSDYLRLLRSFGDLRLWLLANGLATQFELAVPDRNCTDDSNCQSGICRDVPCELNGTTHTGAC